VNSGHGAEIRPDVLRCFTAITDVYFYLLRVVTLVVAASAARIAGVFPAIVSAFLAAAIVPNRGGQNFQSLSGQRGVITVDDEIATAWISLSSLVANHHVETGTGMERCREEIIDQFPRVSKESNACYGPKPRFTSQSG